MFEPFASPRPPPVVVLAGGFGTRVRHLLNDVPKPMAPVGGRPFVEWVVRFYARHGCTEFILSTGFLAEVVAAHFARGPVPGVRVTCRPETEPLGTAGGFLNCLPEAPLAGDVWLVANGDSLALADPRPLIAPLEAGRADAALLGLAFEDAGRYGTLEVGEKDRLLSFREKRPGAGLINAGVYAFSGAAIRGMPAKRPLSFERDVFPGMASAGRATVARTTAKFLDIGTPDSLAQAERFIADNRQELLP